MEEEQGDIIGKAFVEHYYHLFDNERASLSSLYQPDSMLTFEGQQILGVNDISTKLQQLPFERCRHVVSTIDTQPSSVPGSILIFVSGSIEIPEEEHPLRYSQMFHLVPSPQGNLFVQNDIFRLNYG
ncbi:hypothetical protein IC582_029499 [Cucumis melo]|uniref:Nuclear transport factor 2 n=1 Tax=Cucumis melo TaxID=3656 RepID=A0A1S3B3B7_CUCME|nr:nuclear transport factor 2B [Cucumis melo]